LRSAEKALAHLGAPVALTADPGIVRDSLGVVLPGVGHFGACMAALRTAGLDDLARDAATSGRPFLGVCIGMQMLFEGSDEAPGVEGLGVLPGRVTRLPPTVKLPQIGWNTVEPVPGAALVAGLPDPAWLYFVHSYAPETDETVVAAWCNHGRRFPAAVERGNLWATQFHPEKSGAVGLRLLANFVSLCDATAGAAAADVTSTEHEREAHADATREGAAAAGVTSTEHEGGAHADATTEST
jgi:glutamine amidotransferase